MNRREFVARLKDTALGAALLPLLGKQAAAGPTLLEPSWDGEVEGVWDTVSEEELQIDQVFPDYLVCHFAGNSSRILVAKGHVHQVSPWDGRTVKYPTGREISFTYHPEDCNIRLVTDGIVTETQVLDPRYRIGQRIMAVRCGPIAKGEAGETIDWLEEYPIPSEDHGPFRVWVCDG